MAGDAGLLRCRLDVVLVVDRERSHQHAQALGAGRIFADRALDYLTGRLQVLKVGV